MKHTLIRPMAIALKEIVTRYTSLFAAIILMAITSSSWSAEKIAPKSFKNVDEVIGWLKAKGECEKIGKGRSQRCKIKIELPEDKRPDTRGKSVWDVWAWIILLELKDYRDFSVSIVKSRHISLSASDAKNRVRSGKVSTYSFGKKGKIARANVGFFLENFKGETILREDFPVPEGRLFDHGEAVSDLIILQHNLGFGWKFYR